MDNTGSFELVETGLADVETELGKLDQYLELAGTSRATIDKLTADIADLHADKGGLEQKTRASRLTSAKTLLELEEGDLAAFEREIDRQSDRVVQIAQRAQSLLQQVWSALLAARKASVEAKLHADFDFRAIHTPATEFSSAAFSVLEVERIRSTLFNYRMADERDLAIADARAMRSRSAGLLTMAANEPDLELAVVDVDLTPTPKPKPGSSSVNALGTLVSSAA